MNQVSLGLSMNELFFPLKGTAFEFVDESNNQNKVKNIIGPRIGIPAATKSLCVSTHGIRKTTSISNKMKSMAVM